MCGIEESAESCACLGSAFSGSAGGQSLLNTAWPICESLSLLETGLLLKNLI